MQFGHALERILRAVVTADPRHGPVFLLKIDLSDGFYRIRLKAEDTPRLAVAMPHRPGEPARIAVPLTSTMGWVESPPWFTSTTETVVDLANEWLTSWDPPQHLLEWEASTMAP
jgi:hypothetical protein